MAALFDLSDTAKRDGRGDDRCPGWVDAARAQAVLDDSAADQAFGVALDRARQVGGRAGVRRLRDYSRKIAAVEAELLAEHVGSDGDTRRAERMLADGKTSKREQRKKAARAKAVGDNAGLATKMASGAMSAEQVDVIADASSRTNGDAGVDSDLIDKVAAVPPEQGRAIVDDYVAARSTAHGVQSEHDRQRKLRRALSFYAKKNGLEAIVIEGDGIARKQMWDAIEKRADEMYLADGGRDLPDRKHPRTRSQRLFDAAHELICGTPNNQDSNTANRAKRAKRANAAKRASRAKASSSRPRIVITLTLDKLLGRDPASVAIQSGFGPIPDSVLADYAQHADILAALLDRNGDPLWLARLKRHATQTQLIALIIRDKHCVLCGADHTRCEVHHIKPWNAPIKGETNLDELVLLCQHCHHQLHANEHTIYRDHTRTWRTRPATPDEIAPKKPKPSRNQIQQE